MIIIVAIFYAFSLMLFSMLIGMLWYERGFRAERTGTVYAQLTEETVERKVRTSKWDEPKHKRTNAVYSYVVNGIQYHRSCSVIDRFKPMPSSTKLIYQQKKPKAAYLPEFEVCSSKVLNIALVIGGLIFAVLGTVSLFYML